MGIFFVNNMVYLLLPHPGKKVNKNMIKFIEITKLLKEVLLNQRFIMLKRKMLNMINKDPIKENVSTVANPAISTVIANRNLLS